MGTQPFTKCVDIVGSACKAFDGTKRYVSTGAVDTDHINEAETQIVDFKGKPSRANLEVLPGDVLFAKMQGTKKTLLIDTKLADDIFSTGFCAVHAKEGVLTNRCLYYLLTSELFLAQKDKHCAGATQKAITNTGLSKITIKVPGLTDQESIANQLDAVSDIITKRQQELIALDDLIKARFVEMFGSINDNRYEKRTLPEIVLKNKDSIKRGPFGGALKKEDFVESGYLVYEQRHAIHDDFEYAKYYITKEKYENMIGFKVVPGDLIISCSGVTLGRIAEIPKGAKEGIINQALLKLSLDPEVMLNPFFIQQFRGDEIQEVLFGFRRGSGIPNMPSMGEVKAVEFICPPIDLQRQYCTFVTQVDKSKVVVQKALDKVQLLFDSLMQEYFG